MNVRERFEKIQIAMTRTIVFFFKNRSFGSVSSLMTIVGTSYTGEREREREENH